jgi:hypothetical protein
MRQILTRRLAAVGSTTIRKRPVSEWIFFVTFVTFATRVACLLLLFLLLLVF